MAIYRQIRIWIENYMYSSWTGFLCVKALMISMKPIHVGKVILVQLLRSIFHWKRLQYVLMINLRWIVKCALQLGGGTACSEFITIRQSPVRWESYQAQHNIVTSLLRFAKKSFYDRANRDFNNPDINCKLRSGGQWLIGHVVDKIPHLFPPLLKTKCPFLVPIK